MCDPHWRRIFVITLFLPAALAAAGCSRIGKTATAEHEDISTIDIVRPAELFRGNDLKRLEPHLGLTSGCVAVEMKKGEWTVQPTLEVWTSGKPGEPHKLGRSSGEAREVSISFREIKNEHDQSRLKITVVFKTDNSSAAHQIELDGPKLPDKKMPDGKTSASHSFMPKPLPKEIRIKDESGAAVWGYMGSVGDHLFMGDESIENMAKRVEWALVLKLVPIKADGK
jgi:hypothetical protein